MPILRQTQFTVLEKKHKMVVGDGGSFFKKHGLI
jgi:hypothetical protein